MLARASSVVKSNLARRSLATLVATEEFSFAGKLEPIVPSSGRFRESTLANGIKIITKDSTSPIVDIDFTVIGGSAAENPAQKGASLILKKGAFKGNPVNTGLRLIRNLEDVGARIQTASDREKISYKISVLADKIETVIETLAIEIKNTPQSFRIVEAQTAAHATYGDLASNPVDHLTELLHEAAFGAKSAHGASAYAYSLSAWNDIADFRNHSFTGNNFVVSGSGIAHDALRGLVEKSFGSMPAGSSAVAQSAYVGGEVRQRQQINSHPYVSIAFPVPAGDSAKPYHVIFAALNGMRKETNDGGVIAPFLTNYHAGGLLGVTFYGSLSTNENIAKAVGVLKELAAGASSVEGAKIKASLAAALAADSRAAVQVVDLTSISVASVAEAAKTILKSNPSVAVLGNVPSAITHSEVVALLK